MKLPENFNSDSRFINDTSEINPSPPTEEAVSPQHILITQVENLKDSLLFVPGAIRPITESILDLVLFILILTKNEDNNPSKEDEYEIITPATKPPITNPDKVPDKDDIDDNDAGNGNGNGGSDSNGNNDDGANGGNYGSQNNGDSELDLEDIFKGGHKPKIILKHITTSPVKIDQIYSQSTLDISQYFVDRIGSILANYNCDILINPTLVDVLEVTYDNPLVDYKNQVAHSILQSLLKSQQQKISKMRLYQKLYNSRESLTLLKSLEYSKLTLLKLTNEDNFPNQQRLLAKHLQTIETEQQKLEKKIFEYYRYLDGSLDALETCLNLNITEAIAKVELNKINKEATNDSTD